MDFGVFTLVAMWLLVHPKLPSPLSTSKETFSIEPWHQKLKLLPITMISKTPSCQILPLFFFFPFFSHPLQSNGNVGELVYEHEKDPFEMWFNVVWNDCIAFVLDFTQMWQSIWVMKLSLLFGFGVWLNIMIRSCMKQI